MKDKLNYLKKLSANNLARTGFGVIALGASAASFAELPAPATAAITSISGSVTEMETAVWPVIGAVVLAMIIIKLFKRFTAKI